MNFLKPGIQSLNLFDPLIHVDCNDKRAPSPTQLPQVTLIAGDAFIQKRDLIDKLHRVNIDFIERSLNDEHIALDVTSCIIFYEPNQHWSQQISRLTMKYRTIFILWYLNLDFPLFHCLVLLFAILLM